VETTLTANTKIGADKAATWKKLIKDSYDAALVERDKDTTITAAQKENWAEEFIGAWYMLLVDTFDPLAASKVKFMGDLEKTTETGNSFGKEFGTLYKALTDKTAANAKIDTICYNAKKDMYAPKYAAHVMARTKGKYYAKNLNDFLTLGVEEKKLLTAGYAMMPFNAERLDVIKDIDD